MTVTDLSLFAGLTESARAQIDSCATEVQFMAAEQILAEHGLADRFFVLRQGRATIEIHDSRRGPLVIETLGPGEVVGVSWLLPPYHWNFDARAVTPIDAVAIDAACLRGKCDADPQLGYELYRRFAGLIRDRLQAARLQLLDLYSSDHG